MSEPLRKLLSHDSVKWTPEAFEAIRQTAKLALSHIPWLAYEPALPVRAEARLVPDALALLMLQKNPEKPREWLPVASWSRLFNAQERTTPVPMLEAKAF